MKIAKLLSAARVFDVPEQLLRQRISLDPYAANPMAGGLVFIARYLQGAFENMSNSADYFKIVDVSAQHGPERSYIDLTYKALSPASIQLDQQLCKELEEAEHTIADLNGAIQALEQNNHELVQTNHEQDRKIRRLSQENKAYFIATLTLLLAAICAAVLGGGL
jgi:hypothetical protein